jgi:hypothetical protein
MSWLIVYVWTYERKLNRRKQMAEEDRVPIEVDLSQYEDPIIQRMKELDIPITRTNYINFVHFPESGPWDAELESTMPERLQDFDALMDELKRKRRRRK